MRFVLSIFKYIAFCIPTNIRHYSFVFCYMSCFFLFLFFISFLNILFQPKYVFWTSKQFFLQFCMTFFFFFYRILGTIFCIDSRNESNQNITYMVRDDFYFCRNSKLKNFFKFIRFVTIFIFSSIRRVFLIRTVNRCSFK